MVKLEKFYSLAILFVIIISVGCNSDNIPSKTATQKAAETGLEAAVSDSAKDQANKQEIKQNVFFRQKRDADVERILADGSQYIKMKDGDGNTIEFRYFDGNTGLKYISMQTLADGSTSIIIRTREGAIKRVKPTQIANPWRAPMREIALLAGVSLDYRSAPERSVAPVAVERQPPVQTGDQTIKIEPQTILKSTETATAEPEE